MNILRFAFELFLLYMLYKLIVDFIIPVYRSTTKIKRQFGEMESRMQRDYQQRQNTQTQPAQQEPSTKEGEYIEFEEVKK